MYTLRTCLKSFFVFFLFSCQSQTATPSAIDHSSSVLYALEQPSIVCGAERTDAYVSILAGKRVGIVANQTSMVGQTHLVDTLLALGIDVVCVFSPEHGFRGTADAGEKVDSQKDSRTGLPLISLYGKNKKPTEEQLKNLDLILFDIQDVGARFYTYISTLHYVMEAAAENNKQVLVLDRPNPNGHYVDGPVLQTGYTSFVGMHPIPIVHGMTIAEYAQMINGEGWLKGNAACSLAVVLCHNYDHQRPYALPIAPSPNLRSDAAIALYPSLCLFEGTILSEGRGTDYPFEIFGHPALPDSIYDYQFTPKSGPGSKYPKLENQLCNGLKLTHTGEEGLSELRIDWLIDAYHHMGDESFFITKNRWFDILAGGKSLRTQILAGRSAAEIRASWQVDLDEFRIIRAKYLLYDE
jgi:uncharacterized protein YbbC (DUF1343 family)